MTPAATISFFKPEFNDFLHAPICETDGELPLSVLSALTRLNIDPWKEAAELSKLPTDSATSRLASLLMRLPTGHWTVGDARKIADRLIALLPSPAHVSPVNSEQGPQVTTKSWAALLLICAALMAITMFAAELSSRSDRPDAPVLSTAG